MFLSAMKDGARSLNKINKHVFWSCWYTLFVAQHKEVSTVTKVVSNISSLNSIHSGVLFLQTNSNDACFVELNYLLCIINQKKKKKLFCGCSTDKKDTVYTHV